MLDVDSIREDFPILKRTIGGHGIVYFDNAASSLKPRQVVEEISRFYLLHYANIHRGIHTLSEEASEMYEESRKVVAGFIGADGEELVFVKNATEAINLVALGWAEKNCSEGDGIVITEMEHHSNMLPWAILSKKKGLKLELARVKDDGTIDMEQMSSIINERTKVVSVAHVSNVLGTVNPVREICKLAHEVGAICLVDGAQSVPHIPVNVREIDCDFLAFSAHKMLGPTGIGGLYGKRSILEDMEPPIAGGGMVTEVSCNCDGCAASWTEPPLRFEAGTPHIAGAIGFRRAVEYLEDKGIESIGHHEKELTRHCLRLLEGIRRVKVLGPLDTEIRSGIVSFTVEGFEPHEIALLLDSHGIAVRSGHHCAQPLHRKFGIPNGSVRASFYLYNTREEVEYFCGTLEKIVKMRES